MVQQSQQNAKTCHLGKERKNDDKKTDRIKEQTEMKNKKQKLREKIKDKKRE